MALINLLHPAYVCVMRTAKCHTYTLLYTHTHSRCIFPNLVLCACFIRLCCWSDKVARFELSRPHMSAWGQSNYRWWSRWWCIQANTHCNISMSWHSLYARKCSLCSLMIIQANISVDLKTYQTTDKDGSFCKGNQHRYCLFNMLRLASTGSKSFINLVWHPDLDLCLSTPSRPECRSVISSRIRLSTIQITQESPLAFDQANPVSPTVSPYPVKSHLSARVSLSDVGLLGHLSQARAVQQLLQVTYECMLSVVHTQVLVTFVFDG